MEKIKSHLNLVEAERKRDLFQSMVQDVTSELKEAEVIDQLWKIDWHCNWLTEIAVWLKHVFVIVGSVYVSKTD